MKHYIYDNFAFLFLLLPISASQQSDVISPVEVSGLIRAHISQLEGKLWVEARFLVNSEFSSFSLNLFSFLSIKFDIFLFLLYVKMNVFKNDFYIIGGV
jgi:hypothetical protein